MGGSRLEVMVGVLEGRLVCACLILRALKCRSKARLDGARRVRKTRGLVHYENFAPARAPFVVFVAPNIYKRVDTFFVVVASLMAARFAHVGRTFN